MKKILIAFILLFLTTGCTVVRIDTSSIDNITSVILSKDNKLYNRIGKGYKYYRPRGVSYIDTNELNDVLYSNGNYYYLYIDAVGYYHKTKLDYKENKKLYYSKKINDKKEGYLEIKKKDKKYLITFDYNYAKIEALVKKKDINKVVLDASYILSTVKFNDNIIALMLDEEYFTNKEEQYTKFKVKKENKENFLKYNDDKK
ncbi:MAG: hypothetical protein IJ715_01400 [Bacilli bacterium]|nr:hypothetical protein [Bacilli bacterium]